MFLKSDQKAPKAIKNRTTERLTVCPGISGQLMPESGGLVHQNLQSKLFMPLLQSFTRQIRRLSKEKYVVKTQVNFECFWKI
jgi:hypothetical protein